MKTPFDPRHKKRVELVKSLFANAYHPQPNSNIKAILTNLTDLDKIITLAAPEWPLKNINRVDLAILRVATYELTQTDTPHKVVIDEAVEIAKTYGAENSASFVNGVLATILDTIKTS